LQPLLALQQRLDAFQRYWLGFDNTQTVAIHSALKTLQVPTLIVWGLKDFFFDKKWAYWLKETMPGAKRVVEVEDARLFFPEDRPDALAVPVLEFWNELSKTCVDGRRHAQQTSTYDEILRISRRRVGKACRG